MVKWLEIGQEVKGKQLALTHKWADSTKKKTTSAVIFRLTQPNWKSGNQTS